MLTYLILLHTFDSVAVGNNILSVRSFIQLEYRLSAKHFLSNELVVRSNMTQHESKIKIHLQLSIHLYKHELQHDMIC